MYQTNANAARDQERAVIAGLIFTIRVHSGRETSHLADGAIRLLARRGLPIAAIEEAAGRRLAEREQGEAAWATAQEANEPNAPAGREGGKEISQKPNPGY